MFSRRIQHGLGKKINYFRISVTSPVPKDVQRIYQGTGKMRKHFRVSLGWEQKGKRVNDLLCFNPMRIFIPSHSDEMHFDTQMLPLVPASFLFLTDFLGIYFGLSVLQSDLFGFVSKNAYQ